jgi:hypothetical protein
LCVSSHVGKLVHLAIIIKLNIIKLNVIHCS